MTGTRRAAAWVQLVLVTLVVIGVVLQIYFIASWNFGAGDALDAHKTAGGIVHGLEILSFIAALVAFWGSWGLVGLAFSLPLIGTIQLAFASDERSDGWVHGLHGLLAMVVFVLAAVITHKDMRLLGLRSERPAV